MRRHVVVGSGPAGISAAEAIRRIEPAAEILVIGQEPEGFYSRPGLAYYLSGEVSEGALFPFRQMDFERLGVRLLRARVAGLLPDAHHIVLEDGTHLPYDRLLLAPGAEALPLKVPGAELAGVVRLDSLDDVRGILKLCHGRQTAVVVGGGITALELVEGLRARGVKVHYFMRQARYWSNVLDEAESGIIEERLAKEGVVIHPHTELAEIIGQRGRVGGVRTTGGQELKCSLVGYAIGVWPRVKLARGARLAVKRGILVDAYLQTSATDVYAAGDAAEVFDPASGQTVLDSLWWIACAVGRAAGQNMADCETPYVRTAPINVTRLAGLTTTIIGAVGRGGEAEQLGIARGDSEAWRQVPDALGAESGSPVNHLRLAVGRQALLGAVLMGDQSLSRPLQHLISEQADISAIRADLLGGSRPLGETILSYWADWKVKHAS